MTITKVLNVLKEDVAFALLVVVLVVLMESVHEG
jgi:hypothetical protein